VAQQVASAKPATIAPDVATRAPGGRAQALDASDAALFAAHFAASGCLRSLKRGIRAAAG